MNVDKEAAGLLQLLAIVRRLRDPETGCSWDIAQTFATIAPYTIEEAYEVADAIARDDIPSLIDELGDLQLQIVFQAVIAEQADLFALPDVLDAIGDKMERRHPHIFGDAETPGWEAITAGERGTLTDHSALAGIPLASPALNRAHKLQSRAAMLGFDWLDIAGARAKVAEELAEVDAATTVAERSDEIGDLLFAVVNLARKYEIDAETALRAASGKFEARFRHMEGLAPDFGSSAPEEQERLWQIAKRTLAQADADKNLA